MSSIFQLRKWRLQKLHLQCWVTLLPSVVGTGTGTQDRLAPSHNSLPPCCASLQVSQLQIARWGNVTREKTHWVYIYIHIYIHLWIIYRRCLWKMTFIGREEKSMPGSKASKDWLTLLLGGANEADDLKLKPVLIYHSENVRALRNHDKSTLPVFCKWNKAWMTAYLLTIWFTAYFSPTLET